MAFTHKQFAITRSKSSFSVYVSKLFDRQIILKENQIKSNQIKSNQIKSNQIKSIKRIKMK